MLICGLPGQLHMEKQRDRPAPILHLRTDAEQAANMHKLVTSADDNVGPTPRPNALANVLVSGYSGPIRGTSTCNPGTV